MLFVSLYKTHTSIKRVQLSLLINDHIGPQVGKTTAGTIARVLLVILFPSPNGNGELQIMLDEHRLP